MKFTPEQLASLPKSRRAAEDAGNAYYYTGVPCKHGHVSARYLCNTGCLECVNKTLKRVAMPGVAQLTFPVMGSPTTRAIITAHPELLDVLRTILLQDAPLIDWLVARAQRGENGHQPTPLYFKAGRGAPSWDSIKLLPEAIATADEYRAAGWTPEQLVEYGIAEV